MDILGLKDFIQFMGFIASIWGDGFISPHAERKCNQWTYLV